MAAHPRSAAGPGPEADRCRRRCRARRRCQRERRRGAGRPVDDECRGRVPATTAPASSPPSPMRSRPRRVVVGALIGHSPGSLSAARSHGSEASALGPRRSRAGSVRRRRETTTATRAHEPRDHAAHPVPRRGLRRAVVMVGGRFVGALPVLVKTSTKSGTPETGPPSVVRAYRRTRGVRPVDASAARTVRATVNAAHRGERDPHAGRCRG